jgi:hypothetical protein
MRSVFVFKARDWEHARLRAIEIGKQAEATYENADGQTVSRRLVNVETLDLLGDEIADGREVYFEPMEPGEDAMEVLARFVPEESRPGHSGV